MGTSTLLLVAGIAVLGFFVIRFGRAMSSIEQRVSDIQDRLDGVGSS
jgi:hypothetical protein